MYKRTFTTAVFLITLLVSPLFGQESRGDLSAGLGYHLYSERGATNEGVVEGRVRSLTVGLHARRLINPDLEFGVRADLRFPLSGWVSLDGEREEIGPGLFSYFVAYDTNFNVNFHTDIGAQQSFTLGPGLHIGVIAAGIPIVVYDEQTELHLFQMSLGPNLEASMRFQLSDAAVARVSIAPYYDIYAISTVSVPDTLRDGYSGGVNQFGLNITGSMGFSFTP